MAFIFGNSDYKDIPKHKNRSDFGIYIDMIIEHEKTKEQEIIITCNKCSGNIFVKVKGDPKIKSSLIRCINCLSERYIRSTTSRNIVVVKIPKENL